jgi:hyperosmotically inducible protein
MTGTVAALAAVALLGVASAGCVPVLVGAAAAGGYYLGNDDRPAGQIAEDAAITTRVKSRLAGDRYVDAFAINVDTHTGVVTLHGAVATRIEREQAGRLARGVGGVRRVDNRIRVQPPASMADTNDNS